MTRIELAECQILGLRADNPGPFTLGGTNSWILGEQPGWLVDPGPAIAGHAEAIVAELARRGGLGGIALTHDHHDHDAAVPAIRCTYPDAPLAAARGQVDVTLSAGDHFGPLEAIATPGHAPDHLAFIAGRACFTGDAVLGEGSVFIAPDPGALASYLEGLERLARRDLAVLCPGHGPLVTDPRAKLQEYVAHRLDREQRLLVALYQGARTVEEMLDAAWADVPQALRPAAAEARLPDGVERPAALRLSEPRG